MLICLQAFLTHLKKRKWKMKSWHGILSALLALSEGNLPVTGGSPSQKASNAELYGLYSVDLHKLLNNQFEQIMTAVISIYIPQESFFSPLSNDYRRAIAVWKSSRWVMAKENLISRADLNERPILPFRPCNFQTEIFTSVSIRELIRKYDQKLTNNQIKWELHLLSWRA